MAEFFVTVLGARIRWRVSIGRTNVVILLGAMQRCFWEVVSISVAFTSVRLL